jgi:hypothetical protein
MMCFYRRRGNTIDPVPRDPEVIGHLLELGDPVTGCDEGRHAHSMECGDRLLCPVEWPAPRRDGKLDAPLRHVDDRPAVQGHDRLLFADCPDIADAFLQVAYPCAVIGIEDVPDLASGRDLPRAADTEPDIVPYKILREECLRRCCHQVLGVDREDNQHPVGGTEGEGRGLNPGKQFMVADILCNPVGIQERSCTVENNGY